MYRPFPVRRTALAVLGALLVACGSDSGPDDGDPSSLEAQTTALFPAGATRDSAEALRRTLEGTTDGAVADSIAFALVEYTLDEFEGGRLAPPDAELPERLDRYVTEVLLEASVATPDLEPAAFTPEGLVAVLRPAGGTFTVGTSRAGIEVPANAVTRPVLLAAYRLPDSSRYAPGEGPLPTTLDQWPLFYEFFTAPAVTFAEDATLGLCPITEPASAYYVNDDVLARLQIGQPNRDAPGTVELLDRVAAPAWLECDGVTTSLRAALVARRPGIGGRVRRFSPKALVDAGQAPPVGGISPVGAAVPGIEAGEIFGSEVVLSADGTRFAASAPTHGDLGVGRVSVYQRSGTTWTRLGSDLIGQVSGGIFGNSIDLNAAGTRLVVGAFGASTAGPNAGRVQVFDFAGGSWTQVGATIEGAASAQLGADVAISDDGTRIVASATSATSRNGTVRVYQLAGNTWTPLGTTLAVPGLEFGYAVAISGDGRRVAVGAPSNADFTQPGSVFVYEWNGSAWVQVGATIRGKATNDRAGAGVALNLDGSRVAVTSSANGDGGTVAGQVRVYDLVGGAWTQVGGDVNGAAPNEQFGEPVALSSDGTTLLANSLLQAVPRLYRLTGGTWTRVGVVPAARGGVAVSANGGVIAIGATQEQNSTGAVRVYSVSP